MHQTNVNQFVDPISCDYQIARLKIVCVCLLFVVVIVVVVVVVVVVTCHRQGYYGVRFHERTLSYICVHKFPNIFVINVATCCIY